ncbi:amino acid/amide ABC transporter substrate-binding protein, HAAT family [Paracoccus aminovorans]|uniref:Amino acid/amide ABC transporter substrate-binding protein, HAAT family n=1 Tax=Paracoccus aminovorans TaxID=34004 RepID=A0A1I3B3V0_9RHOB|nr:ABC transporter substrate-binding protein [Paracoccus aminovorans]CQR87565.1 ABC-type branched-chain amino acid transport system, periplasmic component [Paracoccus aminovorans]SFH56892.1 amino acid/amide ABC transporter substrate-binding protein, HAAT family [Paracoccus aminovorans]
MKTTTAALALSLVMAMPAWAETVDVGLILSLSGSGAVLGTEMQKGADLALEMSGGKLGGLDAHFVYEDDQRKPDVGKTAAERLTRSEKVDFVIGPSYSNVMMAVQAPIVRSGTPLISPNPAPAELAGRGCNENYFVIPFQNDQPSEALGLYLNEKGVKRVFLLAPNYQAGKDVIDGFKRSFKGEIVSEIYTSLEQNDFSAEITEIRARAPEAVLAFMPGGLGVQFVKQYDQAGLKPNSALYTVFTVFNGVSLDAIGPAAEGVYSVDQWTYDLDNDANRAFVEAYRTKYGTLPSNFAAMAYDSVRLIDGAIAKAGGIGDMDAVRAAMRKASFHSVRGDFAFNNNQHPIHSMYLAKVDKDADGTLAVRSQELMVEKMADSFAQECRME